MSVTDVDTTVPTPRGTDPVGETRAAVDRALAALDRLCPGPAGDRLAQLRAVLDLGVRQAGWVVTEPRRVDREAVLWRLGEPGYARCLPHSVSVRDNSVLVLAPVLLTWAFLGVAEYNYGRRTGAEDLSFFAYWMSRPWYLGPVALSAIIVFTVAVIMMTRWRPHRERLLADEIDRIVLGLEIDLMRPVAELRERWSRVESGQELNIAAVEMSASAVLIGQAAEKLAASATTIARMEPVLRDMVERLPGLEEQVAQLEGLERRVVTATDRLREHLLPLTEMSGRVADLSGQVGTLSTQLRVTTDEVTDRLRSATVGMGAAVEQVQRTTDRFAELTEVMAARVDTATEAVSSAVINAGDSLSSTVDSATAAMSASVADTGRALVDAVGASGDRIASVVDTATGRMDRTVRESTEGMSVTIGRAVAEMTVTVGGAADQVVGRIDSASDEVSNAAANARAAVDRAAVIADQTQAQLARVAGVGELVAGHTQALTSAQQPLTEAVTTFANSAGLMDAATRASSEMAAELRKTVQEVAWMALVADGLRHPDDRPAETS